MTGDREERLNPYEASPYRAPQTELAGSRRVRNTLSIALGTAGVASAVGVAFYSLGFAFVALIVMELVTALVYMRSAAAARPAPFPLTSTLLVALGATIVFCGACTAGGVGVVEVWQLEEALEWFLPVGIVCGVLSTAIYTAIVFQAQRNEKLR